MGEDGTFYKGVFLMAIAFGTGFGVGYKVKSTANIKTVTDFAAFSIKDMTRASFYQAKEWRMEWLKRRRERLAVKLQETQREIELMKTS